MGIDYSFYLRVGFELHNDDVSKPYETTYEEKFHYEDRFDSKTGKKLKPEKVIDQHGGDYFFLEYEGTEYESLWEVINETDYFHKKLDCEISTGFESDTISFYLEVPDTETIGCGRVNVYGAPISLSWIAENREKLETLKQKLIEEFNVDPGEPSVFVEPWIG